MSAPTHDGPRNRVEHVAAALGYTGEPGFLRRADSDTQFASRHALRHAFDRTGIAAVYAITATSASLRHRYIPVAYIADVTDERNARRIHTEVWSQELIPILLICTPTGVQIRNGFEPPSQWTGTVVPWSEVARVESGQGASKALDGIRAASFKTSVAWKDYTAVRAHRVDAFMLGQINHLAKRIASRSPVLRPHPAIVNSAIGRFLYLYLLVDKKFLTQAWIDALRDAGQPACPDIRLVPIDAQEKVWPANQVWALFDAIDAVMNGAIFPIAPAERDLLTEDVLHEIRRVMRNADRVEGDTRALGMFEVSFASLRTETISGMYELFLSLRLDDTQVDDGAYYTPPFLADLVLDMVEDVRPFDVNARVLDPSTGSGIFLVGAYRRILERAAPKKGWSAPDLPVMREILERCIAGIERDAQAANIARFSLYLTMLEDLVGSTIDDLATASGERRVFPPLAQTIVTQDAFSTDVRFSHRFTHVIGNPPWGSLEKRSERNAATRRTMREAPAVAFQESLDRARPVAERRQSELFVWRVERDFLEEGGVTGLVISTRSFVARTADAFPNALTQRLNLIGLADFSHFRYHLFKGAKAPALAVIARKAGPDTLAPRDLWIYAPRLDTQAFGGKGELWSVVVSERDIEYFAHRDLTERPNGWAQAIILKSIDRRFAAYIQASTQKDALDFGGFIARSGVIRNKGASPRETGLPASRHIDPATYVRDLGLDDWEQTYTPLTDEERDSLPDRFRSRFSGRILLLPRNAGRFDFIESPIYFSSSFNCLHLEEDASEDRRNGFYALAKYLNSAVGQYLLSLVGRTYRLDKRRLEWGDLASLPIPARDLEELARIDQTLTSSADWTAVVATRFALTRTPFADVVEEYTTFRQYYRDAQIPETYRKNPDVAMEIRYRETVLGELGKLFGDTAKVSAEDRVAQEGLVGEWHVAITTTPKSVNSKESSTNFPARQMRGEFVAAGGTLTFDPNASRLSIAKPWTQASWTLEQAFLDVSLAKSLILGA